MLVVQNGLKLKRRDFKARADFGSSLFTTREIDCHDGWIRVDAPKRITRQNDLQRLRLIKRYDANERTRRFTANAVPLFCIKTHHKTVISKHATIGQSIKR